MPARKVFERDRILKNALKIVKKDGMEGLNMRSLAKVCNCSTQPVYNSFSGMTELKRAVAREIIEIYHGYIRAELALKAYPDYKATGMGYIRFAREEPQLFKYLFMRDRSGAENIDEDSGFNDEVINIVQSMGIPRDKAEELHVHMWIWVHGIATMYATGYLAWDWQTVSRMLTDAFMGIKQRLGI